MMDFRRWLETNDPLAAWLAPSTVKQIVYHGTDKSPFGEFSFQKSQRFVLFASFDVEAKGFFFSESPYDALEYGRNVAACYVRMTNPLVDPRRDKHLGIDGLPRKKEMDLLKILGALVERQNGEPYIDLGVRRVWLRDRRYNFAHEWIYEAIGPDGLDWDCLDNPAVVQRMIKLGYDGTFVQEPESHLGRSIFVPSNQQVRIVKWLKSPQEDWGHKDDYYTRKDKEGYSRFYGPQPSDSQPTQSPEPSPFH